MFVRIATIVIILASCCTYMVLGRDTQVSVVKVQFSNNSEINIFTTKEKIADILEEAGIVVELDEAVVPGLEEDLTLDKKITICKLSDIIETAVEDEEDISVESLQDAYAKIVEKIETVREKIPFETIKKDATGTGANTTSTILQKGEDGLRETTYRVKYKNDVEISRKEISSVVIKKPVNQIVQVVASKVTSRESTPRNVGTSGNGLAAKVAGITPKVVTMNASAYCACAKCCGKSTGTTASGAKVSEWYTIAAGKGYKMGTIMYIPALKDKPNGGWFVVQDRGGAISNSKIDIYMSSHSQALNFGRKNLVTYVYEF